jgi:pimeloyl-ACP methyl ester carboxylesterase
VLILRGQNSDPLLAETVVEMKRRVLAAKQGRVESVEIPNCGHAPTLMADEQVRLIEDFLLSDGVAGAPRGTAAAGGRLQ